MEPPRIGAVVVTYRCGGRIAQALPAILSQVNGVYLIDNASDAETVEAVKRCAGECVRVTLNNENLGLAAAQNQGIRQALQDGCEWVLLLDDDSVPANDMVPQMLAAWEKARDARIGIVAARIVEQNVQAPSRYLTPCWHGFGFIRKKIGAGEISAKAAVVIASGSLVRADVFRQAGFMAEKFFIDYIDYEFCLRARHSGFSILIAGDAVLHHKQGSKARHGMVITAHYSPLRRYYIFRNRMLVLRSYGRQFPFLIPHEILAYLWDILRIMALEKQKAEKLCQALRGLKDGIFLFIVIPENISAFLSS